jgi:cytoskeletal protein RodZ
MAEDRMGRHLREAREKKGLGLEEAEKATRIRSRFLEALEGDEYGDFASPAQARGFLGIYAEFLGLNVEQVTDWYDSWRRKPRSTLSLQRARPAAPRAQPPGPPPSARPAPKSGARPAAPPSRVPQVRSRRPRWLSVDLFVAVAITVILGTFLVWGALQFSSGQSATPTRTPAPTLTPSATGSAAPTLTPTPLIEATATELLPTPLAFYSGVDVIVRAEQRVWVSVAVDGAVAFAGQMPPGTSKEFNGQNVVEVSTGNGLGTHVIWNGRDQGTLGQIGENVIRLWTTAGPITPTPTLTFTPSKTSTATATPKP